MGLIGIVVNPSSGKDIRRIVSHATVVENSEKINIVERLVLALKAMGDHQVVLMPDGYYLSDRIIKRFEKQEWRDSITRLDMDVNENHTDTTEFVRRMREMGCDVMIVLGGDGTSRAAAKEIGDVPLIAISTGTNNVFPDTLEGTIAGLAAAAIASGAVDLDVAARRCKKIHIMKNEQKVDIALIDAVISKRTYVGSKAIWELRDMEQVIVTQSHPASIGFSALVGCYEVVSPREARGYSIELSPNGQMVKGAISAGMIETYGVKNAFALPVGQAYDFTAQYNGIVAVDGEREVPFKAGERIGLIIEWTGPKKVDVPKTVEQAQRNGFFKL